MSAISSNNFNWLEQVLSAFDPTSAAAHATTMTLIPMGTHLFYAIGALYFALMGLRTMLESSSIQDHLGELIGAFITCGMILSALEYYEPLTGFINTGFDQVTNTLAQSTGNVPVGGNAKDAVWAGFRLLGNHAINLFNGLPINFEMSLWSVIDAANGWLQLSVVLLDVLVTLVAMGVMFLAAVMFMVVYVYSLTMFMLGVIVGPILLPWQLLKPFSYLTEGWIKFLITAGMYRVVSMALIALMGPMLSQMQIQMQAQINLIKQMDVAPGTSVSALASLPAHHLFFSFCVLILACIILYMFMKVPEIVSSLLSGGGGGGLRFGKGGMGDLGGGGGGGSGGSTGTSGGAPAGAGGGGIPSPARMAMAATQQLASAAKSIAQNSNLAKIAGGGKASMGGQQVKNAMAEGAKILQSAKGK